jgi:TolB-like protein
VTDSSHAVFLSYASQDAEAAQRICEALRAAGIEVWFDQSALRGGDVWDQTIRKQIKACVLFIPVLSKHTHDRVEGYFRLEWKLAIDRSHLIAPDQTFLLPVAIDNTREDDERVPDKFRDVHWTRLPGGETPPAFAERVRRLVSPDPVQERTTSASSADHLSAAAPLARARVSASWRTMRALLGIVVVAAGALAYLATDKLWVSEHQASPPKPPAAPASAAPAAFAPPPHSIAVLPFVNMSGDKEQEYFSDGLSEELLNSLSRINELQVAARTSSFYFKGKDVDLGMVARKLNVAAVLEGSVRKSSKKVRVTAQLVNAVTGFHLWSQTYDRDLSDVLELQTEIANAVANALKVTLLGDAAAKIEVGGTRDPAAFDAYLKGWKRYYAASKGEDMQASSTLFSESVRLDPGYALAYMARSWSFSEYGRVFATTSSMREEFFAKALADAEKSIELAPDLGEGYGALGSIFESRLEFESARKAYESSRAFTPGSARVWRNYSEFYAAMGFADEAVTAARRAVTLDPLNALSHCRLSDTLMTVRRYNEALTALNECEALDATVATNGGFSRGLLLYKMGDYAAGKTSCEAGDPALPENQACLSLVYDRLGKHSEAEAELEKLRAARRVASAYWYAQIYAQWGNRAKALEWLDTAMRLREPGLANLKTDALLDPLRKEPRFQAIERELKFPN